MSLCKVRKFFYLNYKFYLNFYTLQYSYSNKIPVQSKISPSISNFYRAMCSSKSIQPHGKIQVVDSQKKVRFWCLFSHAYFPFKFPPGTRQGISKDLFTYIIVGDHTSCALIRRIKVPTMWREGWMLHISQINKHFPSRLLVSPC